MNKYLKYSLIALPILVGGYIVYKQLKPKKKKEQTPPPPPPPPPPTPTPTPKLTGGDSVMKVRAEGFPIKKGSKGAKVSELQNAILVSGNADAVKELGKSGADGSFGSGTERAVKLLLGKATVDNQAEIDKIKKYKVNAQLMEQGENNRITFGKSILEKMPTNLTTLANGNFITKTTFDSTKQREVNKETFTYKKGEIARPWGFRPLVQQKFVADKNTPILQTGTVVMWVTESGKNVRYHFNPYFFAIV